MFNMEEEVENLPSSKPSAEADAEETSEKPDLSDEQKQKLSEALSILSALSEECGCSVEELIQDGQEAQSEMEAGEEGEEESGSESEAADSQGDAESTGKKLALYVAQLKAKRG